MSKNRDLVIENVQQSGISLMFAPEYNNDKEIVLLAVKSDGIAFKYASKELQNDFDFSLQCVKTSHFVFPYVSKELKNNREWILKAVEANPKTYFLLSKEKNVFIDDLMVMIKASKNYATIYEMNKNLLKSQILAEKIIESNPIALKVIHAMTNEHGDLYGNNKKVVYKAIKRDAFAYTFVCEKLKQDIGFSLFAVCENYNVYRYLSNAHKENIKIALCALEKDASLINEIPKKICTTQFLAAAINLNEEVYKYILPIDRTRSLAMELMNMGVNKEIVYDILQNLQKRGCENQVESKLLIKNANNSKIL